MAKMGRSLFEIPGEGALEENRVVTLVGMAQAGACVAARLARFGAKVVFADPMVAAGEGALLGARKVPLDEPLAASDRRPAAGNRRTRK